MKWTSGRTRFGGFGQPILLYAFGANFLYWIYYCTMCPVGRVAGPTMCYDVDVDHDHDHDVDVDHDHDHDHDHAHDHDHGHIHPPLTPIGSCRDLI